MYHITGFSNDDILTLCELITQQSPIQQKATGRKRALGLYKSVVVTLAYLPRNRVQQELAEYFSTSQSTISRVITTMTPVLEAVLREWVPTADDLDPDIQLIVDGTLLPCWSWRDQEGLWSGKHHTTGLTTLLACTLNGTLAWVSDPHARKDP